MTRQLTQAMCTRSVEVAVHDGGPGDVEDAVGVVGVGSHAAHDLGAVEMSSDVGSGQVESRVEKSLERHIKKVWSHNPSTWPQVWSMKMVQPYPMRTSQLHLSSL